MSLQRTNSTKSKLNGQSKCFLNEKLPSLSQETSTKCVTKTHPTVYIVFISLLLDLLAFTMILPLLPSILEYYRLNDGLGLYNTLAENVINFQEFVGAPAKYNSVLFGGFLGSMFSFLQFAVSPIVGGLSDVYGRKPVLLLCLVSQISLYYCY